MEIPDEHIERIVLALQHYAAYMKATSRDSRPFTDIAEALMRKPPASESANKPAAKRKA